MWCEPCDGDGESCLPYAGQTSERPALLDLALVEQSRAERSLRPFGRARPRRRGTTRTTPFCLLHIAFLRSENPATPFPTFMLERCVLSPDSNGDPLRTGPMDVKPDVSARLPSLPSASCR